MKRATILLALSACGGQVEINDGGIDTGVDTRRYSAYYDIDAHLGECCQIGKGPTGFSCVVKDGGAVEHNDLGWPCSEFEVCGREGNVGAYGCCHVPSMLQFGSCLPPGVCVCPVSEEGFSRNPPGCSTPCVVETSSPPNPPGAPPRCVATCEP